MELFSLSFYLLGQSLPASGDHGRSFLDLNERPIDLNQPPEPEEEGPQVPDLNDTPPRNPSPAVLSPREEALRQCKEELERARSALRYLEHQRELCHYKEYRSQAKKALHELRMAWLQQN